MNRRLARVVLLFAIAGGCAHQPEPTTRPSLATTQPSYWLNQPGVAQITSPNFNHLWNACEEAARSYGFVLDRQNYRAGILTTVPLISKQWFEVWRDDVQTPEDLADSSISTYRRTLRFEFHRQLNGSYEVTPSVVIERYAQAEHPVSASVYLKNAFRDTRGSHPTGTPEADWGIFLPARYWYATGRDSVLEKSVARQVEKWLKRS